MRYFKNEPTKLTLGTHQYTPTTDTFFKSRNKESYAVANSHSHNYVPPTSSGSAKSPSARYLNNDQRKHSYVPDIASNKSKEKSARSWPPPITSDVVRNNKAKWPPTPEGNATGPVSKKPVKESAEDKKKREIAARRLQAFVRGAMCRARVSDMLLGLIEGLLSEKETKQQQLEEQKLPETDDEYDEVEVFEDSQHDVFAALDDDEKENGDDDLAEISSRSILKISQHKEETTKTPKQGRSITFVEKENQVLEIERAMEYALLPLWWMETCPHGILPDGETDDHYAVVVPQSEWKDDEEEESPAMESVPTTGADADEQESITEESVDEEEVFEEEIVEEEIIEEVEVVEEEVVEEVESSTPEPTPTTNTTAPSPRSEPKASIPSQAPVEGAQQNSTDDDVDPANMSLAERMKAFQSKDKVPVKKNFRAATFR